MDIENELRRTTRFERLVRFAECASTQTISMTDTAADNAVFWTDHQTAGRGRQGRSWHDTKAQDLAVTLRLVGLQLESPTRLAAAIPVAIARALRLDVPSISIKWPNDILLFSRKLSGILIDTGGHPPTTFHVGIGINVNRATFPPELLERSISIALATGRETDREALLLRLAQSVSGVVDELTSGESAALATEFAAGLRLLGKRVIATSGTQVVEGTLTHIDLDNAILDGDMAIPLAHLQRLARQG